MVQLVNLSPANKHTANFYRSMLLRFVLAFGDPLLMTITHYTDDNVGYQLQSTNQWFTKGKSEMSRL